MLFQRNKLQMSELSQKSHVNWYLEQVYWKTHLNICTSQSNKSIFKKKDLRISTILHSAVTGMTDRPQQIPCQWRFMYTQWARPLGFRWPENTATVVPNWTTESYI